jgi:hypothetical protein
LAVLFYFKPKEMLKLIGIALVVVAALYLLSLLGDVTTTGITHKREILD